MLRKIAAAAVAMVVAPVLVNATPATAAPAESTLAAQFGAGATTGLLPTCTPRAAIDRMVGYIRTQQQSDGSFPSIGQSSTADAVYALAASGVNPSRVTQGGNSAIDWIYSQTGNLESTGVTAKFLLALLIARRSTTAPNGFNFVTAVANSLDPATGLYDPNPTGNAYALIALRAAGRRVPSRALDAWAALQQPDGGWSAYIPVRETDTNTTAVGIIALIVNGRTRQVPAALRFFRTQQSADGGFTFSTVFGTASDANSTGLTILALLASGQNLANWERNRVDPVERLLQLQNPSGAFRFNDEFPADNAFATFQAGQAAGVTRCRR
jgi:prenyltransferase beta subunit